MSPLRRALTGLSALSLTLSLAVGPPGASASMSSTGVESLYFVVLSRPPLSSVEPSARTVAAARAVRASQAGPIAAARSLEGDVGYRYTRVLNGFSVRLSAKAASALAETPGVSFVEPVPIVRRALSRSVPSIGAPKTWNKYGVKGRGVKVAVVDTGIDYTHRAFNGAGTVAAYDQNDPTVIEPGTFPTGKVIAGNDFVGDDYDVLDNDVSNDTPMPDPDPLDGHGHGTHVASTCCGKKTGSHGKGVAPQAKLHAYKVWGEGGSSTADVLVAAYERAVDPNEDGDLSDRVDVLNFSGGVYYGTRSSAEALAAQGVVDAGTVFVAAAGNSGGDGYRVGAPAAADGVLSVAASNPITDRITSFSSSGPSRDDAAIKPEITAPGDGIRAAAVGSGTGSLTLSGTSMAAPHVSGAAALMIDLHPRWSPAEIKASLTNQAKRRLSSRGIEPAPVMFMGAGLVKVHQSARSRSLILPGTVSWGVEHASQPLIEEGDPFVISNRDKRGHRYILFAKDSYANVPGDSVEIHFSVNGSAFLKRVKFRLGARSTAQVIPRLQFDPGSFTEEHGLMSHYRDLPVADGIVVVRQRGGWRDTLKAPWLLVPYAASEMGVAADTLDLTSGSAQLMLDVAAAPGIPAADVYVHGGTDATGEMGLIGEEDIVHIGARSFTGPTLGDGPTGVPPDDDVFGDPWLEQVQSANLVQEPVEFFIGTAQPHHTIETLTARVYIDAGADGVFADDTLKADYVLEKESLVDDVCIRDLAASPDSCKFSFGLDYRYFDTTSLGMVVDAAAIGLSAAETDIAYKVELCTDRFAGDVPELVCDETAGVDLSGTYPATLDIVAPGIELDSWFCGGFWSSTDCAGGFAVTGSPGAPDLLLVFENNVPTDQTAVVTTTP